MLRVFLFLIFLPFALSRISLSTEQGLQITAQTPVTVYWTRDPDDATDFFVHKQKLDEARPLTSEGFRVTVLERSTLSGSLVLQFNRAGLFRFVASRSGRRGGNFIFEGEQFGVSPPTIAQSQATTSVSASAVPSASVIISSEPPSSTDNVTSNTSSQPVRNPVIIASVLGALFLASVVAVAAFIIIRRRRRRKRSPSYDYQQGNDGFASFFSRRFIGQSDDRYARTPSIDSEKLSPPAPVYAPRIPTNREPFRRPSMQPAYDIQSELRPPRRSPSMNTMLTTTTNSTATSAGALSGVSSQMRFSPLTGRQMDLEEQIIDLHSTLIGLQTVDGNMDAPRIQVIRDKIKRLQQLKESPWARGLTDDRPSELKR